MTPYVCAHDHRHAATLMLVPRVGYADSPRPMCRRCYGSIPYYHMRFLAIVINWKNPGKWLEKWRRP